MPVVSVMFLSYNHGAYLEQAVKSVLGQTYQDFEIIFSDDCSNDNTMEIISKYESDRVNIHRFHENMGAAINMKYIWRHCSGKYLALINSDDVWEEDHLEKSVYYLDSHKDCAGVFSWASLIDEQGNMIDTCCEVFQQENRSQAMWLRRLFTGGNCICHPSMVLRREVYDRIGFLNAGLRQLPDFQFWIRVLKNYQIYVIPEVLVKHRRCAKTKQNTSAPVLENSLRDINESLYILMHFFDDLSDDLFYEAFHELFRRKEVTVHEHGCLLCEQLQEAAGFGKGIAGMERIEENAHAKGKYLQGAVLFILLCICLIASDRVSFRICIETKGYPQIGTASLYVEQGEEIDPGHVIRTIGQENDMLVFEIPAYKYHFASNLRLDPVNVKTDLTISRISYTVAGYEAYSISGNEFVQDAAAYAGLMGMEAAGRNGIIHADSTNPVIFLGNKQVEEYNKIHIACSGIKIAFLFASLLVSVIMLRWIRQNDRQHWMGIYNKALDVLYNRKNRKLFLVISAFTFVAVRLWNLVRYEGYYFNDEFYFLAEANTFDNLQYMRAPYLSYLVRLFVKIGGNQYFAVKAVPLFCGIISFSCVLYLVCRMCHHPASILLAGFLMSFHALFQFNDFYVRMYACQETALLLLAVILYQIAVSRKIWVQMLLVFGGFLIAAVIYNGDYGDISAHIPVFVYLCCLSWIAAGSKIWERCTQSRYLKYVVFTFICICLLIQFMSVGIKHGMAVSNSLYQAVPMIKDIVYLMRSFRIADRPVMLSYFLKKEWFYAISFLLAGASLLRKKQTGQTAVFLLAFLPLAALCMLLYDARILRAFIGCLAVSVIIVVSYWDELLEKRCFMPFIAGGCLFTVLLSPVDLGWKEYREQMYLYDEVYFCDYGTIMEDAQKEREAGKDIIALFGGEQVLRYFEFLPDLDLCTWDENQNMNYTNEELVEWLMDAVSEKSGRCVLLMDKAGADKLYEAGLYENILQKHLFRMYHRNIQFNSLYLVYL